MKADYGKIAGWNVLIVDDEPDSLEVAGRVLKFHGVSVYTAGNGKEALGIVSKVKPTIILSDLSMPEMDGWELLHYLREHPGTSEIPVIALTAHAMAGDRERVIKVGFNGYIAKPFSPISFIDDLLGVLSEADLARLTTPAIANHRQLLNQTTGNSGDKDNGQLVRTGD